MKIISIPAFLLCSLCSGHLLLAQTKTGSPLIPLKDFFDNPKISVNSRLFDDFDLDKVEVVVIDGKNLW